MAGNREELVEGGCLSSRGKEMGRRDGDGMG